MAADPQFPINGNLTITSPLTAANTALDGTGTVAIIGTAGSSGAYLYSVNALQAGSNSGVNTVARVFLNNGSTNATAANNILIAEFTCIGNTIAHTASQNRYFKHINMRIPPNWRVMVTIGTASSGGWVFYPVMEDM